MQQGYQKYQLQLTTLLCLWQQKSVYSFYQNSFVDYLSHVPSELAPEQMQKQLNATISGKSLCFDYSSIKHKYNQAIAVLNSSICFLQQKKHKNEIDIKNICINLFKVRQVSLNLAEIILAIYNQFKNKAPFVSVDPYLQEIEAFEQNLTLLKSSFVRKYILLSKGFDPFFICHMEELKKTYDPKLRSFKCIEQLFNLSVNTNYRIFKAHEELVKLLGSKKCMSPIKLQKLKRFDYKLIEANKYTIQQKPVNEINRNKRQNRDMQLNSINQKKYSEEKNHRKKKQLQSLFFQKQQYYQENIDQKKNKQHQKNKIHLLTKSSFQHANSSLNKFLKNQPIWSPSNSKKTFNQQKKTLNQLQQSKGRRKTEILNYQKPQIQKQEQDKAIIKKYRIRRQNPIQKNQLNNNSLKQQKDIRLRSFSERKTSFIDKIQQQTKKVNNVLPAIIHKNDIKKQQIKSSITVQKQQSSPPLIAQSTNVKNIFQNPIEQNYKDQFKTISKQKLNNQDKITDNKHTSAVQQNKKQCLLQQIFVKEKGQFQISQNISQQILKNKVQKQSLPSQDNQMQVFSNKNDQQNHIIKLKAARMSTEQVFTFLSQLQIMPRYRKLFQIRNWQSSIEQGHYYVHKCYVDDVLKIVVLCCALPEGDYVIKYWGAIDCKLALSQLIFIKYLEHIQRVTPCHCIYYNALEIEQMIGCGFQKKKERIYLRFRINPIQINSDSYTPFIKLVFIYLIVQDTQQHHHLVHKSQFPFGDQYIQFPVYTQGRLLPTSVSAKNIKNMSIINSKLQEININKSPFYNANSSSQMDFFACNSSFLIKSAFFKAGEGFIKTLGRQVFCAGQKRIISLQLFRDNGKMYFAKGFDQIKDVVYEIRKEVELQKTIEFSVRMFSKFFRGKIDQLDSYKKICIGSLQFSFVWKDFLKGKILHSMKNCFTFDQNFIVVFNYPPDIKFGFKITLLDFFPI